MDDQLQRRDEQEGEVPQHGPEPPQAPEHQPPVPAPYPAQAAPMYQPPGPPPYQAPVPPVYQQPGGVAVAPKNPGVHLLVSFFLPGVGSMMADRVGIGITILALWIVSIVLDFTIIGLIIGLPLGLGVWIWGMVDAFQGAKAWNARRGIIS